MVTEGDRHWPWAIAFSLLIGVVVAFSFSEWGFDDPFITYRYADNLHGGLGFVYNPGERVLSTTTPLFALMLAGLEFLWSDLPFLAILVGAFSLVLGVTHYFWFYAPLVPGFLVAAGLGADALAAVWRRALPSAGLTLRLLGGIGLLVLALGLGAHAFELNRHPDSRLLAYRAVGEWLRSNTGQESSVGALEVALLVIIPSGR